MALTRSSNQVTLIVCTARRQTAESVRATPETTVRDAIGQSERAWALAGARLDEVAVCVGGIPRRMHDRVGDTDTIEVYPPVTRGWMDA